MNRRTTDAWYLRYGTVIGYLILAGTLAIGLNLQRQTLEIARMNQLRSACHVLEHRIQSQVAFVTMVGTLRGIAIAAAGDPEDRRFRRAARDIQVPPGPSERTIRQRDDACRRVGIPTEPAVKAKTFQVGMKAISAVRPEGHPHRCFRRRITIEGTRGPDVLIGTPGQDVIHGRIGNDTILGGGGNDRLCGGWGEDVLRGDEGFDRVRGGPGRDSCDGERERGCEE